MKRRIVWINLGLALVIVASAVGVYFWLFAPKSEVATTGRTVSVQTGTVSETVTATGTVETAGTVQLSFANGGTVTAVRVAQGDTVRADQRLAAVDDSAARQGVASAKSSYVQSVTSASSSGLTLTTAQKAVADAQRTESLNRSGYAEAVTQARQELADAKASWSASCLDPTLTCPDTDAWAQLRSAEAEVANAKTAYDQAVQNATASETTQNIALAQAAANIDAAQSKASSDCSSGTSAQCSSAQNALTSAQQQYETTANAKKVSAIQGQQGLVNADAKVTSANVALKRLQASLATNAADSIAAAQKSLDSALLAQRKGEAADKTSVRKAKESLAALQASDAAVSTTAGTVTASQAAIDVAKAGLAQATDALAATVLRSPVAGTVASVDVTKGDTVAAGTPALTVIPKAAYQIVASFSEADALKLAVGQAATVTLDALTDGTATGTVTEVAILPTTSATSSVTTYSATITLDDVPDGIRQGMSASVVVTTDEATGVLWVPTAAVTTAGGQSTVTVRENGVDTTVVVTTGLEGDSGTEIDSGLTEGQQVVIDTSSGSSTGLQFPTGGFGFGQGGPPAGAPGAP